MDLTNILKIGAQAFQNNTDSSTDGLDLSDISSAISDLIGNNEGGLGLSNFLSGMQSGGLASIVASWLGDGDNETISSNQLKEILGQDKIDEFSSKLGIDQEQFTSEKFGDSFNLRNCWLITISSCEQCSI